MSFAFVNFLACALVVWANGRKSLVMYSTPLHKKKTKKPLAVRLRTILSADNLARLPLLVLHRQLDGGGSPILFKSEEDED